MRDRKLERLFARWRERGDAEALGTVFDSTAPELVAVAVHLVRDPVEADDLLQATFLTAIERSSRYDTSERLVPWLVGILVRHAHELRRTRARSPDESRLAERREPEPHEAVEADELSAELRAALERLPARDREVLVPFLYEGKRAVEIAAESGQPAGTVRMQLHRGLERLRKALPAGFALGAAVTLAGGRGLAAVRAEVLRQAALSTPIAVGGAAGLATTLTLGGLVVTKKIALAAVALALALGIGLWMRASSATPRAAPTAQPVALHATKPSEPADIVPLVKPSDTTAAPESRSEVAASTTARPLDEGLVEGLAGITGRIVRASGEPVVDVPVALLEVEIATILGTSLAEVFDRPEPDLELELSRSRTDSEGRFRLGRARALAVHGLAIDPGGPLGTLRVIDRSLRPGEDVDLGDVRLNPTVSLAGRIVDEAGKPIAGARVRAAAVPEEGLMPIRVLSPYQPRSLVIFGANDPKVIDPPAGVESLVEQLPVPTARTDASGAFRLEVALSPRTKVVALVDARGRPNRFLEVENASLGQVAQLGDVVLDAGIHVSGRVVDSNGAPMSRMEVAVGSTSEAEPGSKFITLAQPAGVTDDSGRFACEGLPRGDHAVVAVRAPSAPAWSVIPGLELGAELEVKLPPSSRLLVSARDAQGAAIEGVEILLCSNSLDDTPGALPFNTFVRARAVRSESQPGVLEIRDLPYGRHTLVARAPGFAVAAKIVEVLEPETRAELVLQRAGQLTVEVVDRDSRAPVRGARVSVVQGPGRATLAQSTSDADGKAVLADVGRDSEHALALTVQHPGYATAGIELPEGAQSTRVELDHGGELLAHVREDGHAPAAPVLLFVTPRTPGSSFFLPLLGASDAKGDVSMLRLAPGQYRFQVMPSVLAHELGAFDALLESMQRGDFEIAPGMTTEIEIRLRGMTPSGRAGTARVRGHIVVNGEPAVDWLITAGKRVRATTDVAGNFELDNLPPTTPALLVQRRNADGNYEVLRYVEVHLDDRGEQEIELDLHVSRMRVEVHDADGRPVEGARVVAEADSRGGVLSSVETDARGIVALDVVGTERPRVEASHGERGWGSAEAERDGTPEQTVVVTLKPAVPFSGQLLLPASISSARGALAMLFVQPRTGRARLLGRATCKQEHERWTFEVPGTPAGEYSVVVIVDDTQLGPVPVDLPPSGRDDLVLDFTHSD